MAHRSTRLGRRRAIVAVVAGLAVTGAGALAAGADGGLTVTPSSGAPGSAYKVTVDCGQFPLIYRGYTQDGYVPGTIGSYGSDQVSMVSPSVWQADETAGNTDSTYWATCGQSTVGQGYFDAESPHLWLGPRSDFIGDRSPKTKVEGTDCPAGTTAEVHITYDGDVMSSATAAIDEHGDWSVDLPAPIGSTNMTVLASCGGVTYDRLQLTTTSTSTPGTTPTTPSTSPTTDTTAPGAPPAATPQAGSAGYTG